ncbi:MAG: M48 family metallopeptidase [Candidatus Zixiibacteriota bacterium]
MQIKSQTQKILKTVSLLLLATLLLAACATVPITGRKSLNLIPASTINSMSFQEYDTFLKSNKLSNNATQTAMVKRVGGKIQKAVEQYMAANNLSNILNGYEWDFNLVEDSQVNAWCMPGGKVVVYTGLLPVAQNEAGLAVVMGHEIAHAIANHGNERMTQGLLVQFGGMAIEKALEQKPQETRNLFMTAFGVGTSLGVLLPYSRMHESEADHLGLIFMAMAGYDPQTAVNFWERMAASGGGEPMEFLSTHPSNETRINDIRRLIPEAQGYYKK